MLRLEGVRRTYAPGEGLETTDLEVRGGEVLVVMGPSGSGKSTLLRVIGGFERPDAGRIWLGGRDLTPLAPERRPTAMVFQSHALWPHLTVADHIAFGLRARRLPRSVVAAKVAEMLELLRLRGLERRRPRHLSGGQRQRVALARALAIEPEVLLLDEPFAALDVGLRADLRRELGDLLRRLHVTTLCVTHDEQDALDLADRIGVLVGGRLLQVGTPEEVYERPASAEVARHCGGGLLLPCSTDSAWPGRVCLPGGVQLEVAGGTPMGSWLAVRVEALKLATADGPNRLPGRVLSRHYAGGRVALQVATPAGPLPLQVSAPGPMVGEACFVEMPRDRLWVVA